MAGVSVLCLWTDCQQNFVEPEELQAGLYDLDCSLVYVRQCLAVHDRDVCHDKNLAGKRTDGRHGSAGDVSVPVISGAGECQSGNVAAVYLCVHVGGVCDECSFYGDSYDDGHCSRDDRDQEKKCQVRCGFVSVLLALPAACTVLFYHEVGESQCWTNW